MKKSSLLRGISTCLVVTVFAGMAMASGSSSGSSKETGSVTVGDDTTKVTEETTKEAKAEYEITNTLFTHYTNSIDKEEYSGIIEIKNTGSVCIYLKDCTFDFEDDNGHLLQSEKLISSAPDVIAPGECGYYFGHGYIDDEVSFENGINLVPNFTVDICKNGNEAVIDYEVSDLDIRDNDYGLGVKVTGRVTNGTSEDTNSIDVKIIAIFYDSEGNLLDVGFTYADEMSAGGKASFEISTVFGNEEVSTESVADYKVIARHTYIQF